MTLLMALGMELDGFSVSPAVIPINSVPANDNAVSIRTEKKEFISPINGLHH